MKVLMYTILLSTQLVSILGTPPWLSFQYKCWVLDSPCLTSRAQALVPEFTQATAKSGIGKLDALTLESVDLDEENLKFSATNLQVNGLKDAVVDFASIDLVARVARIVFHTDMYATSPYVTKGFLFSLPIFGEGDWSMNLKNVQFDMLMPFDIIKDSNGEDLMDLKALQYSYDIKDNAHYQLNNLYGGDKIASETMHQLINQNWKILSIEYGRALFDPMITKIFNAMRAHMLSRPLWDIFVL